jgi:hypothetical protein
MHSFKPDFPAEEILFEAEKAYQHRMGQYGRISKTGEELVIYNDRLFGRTEEVTVLNTVDLSERKEKYSLESKKTSGEYLQKFKDKVDEDRVFTKEEFNDFVMEFNDDDFLSDSI